MLAETKDVVRCVLALCVVLGCSKATEPPAAETRASEPAAKKPKSAADGFVLGVSQCNLGEPWRVQMNADIAQAAAKVPKLRLLIKDAQNDSLRQRAQVEELAGQGIDALLVSPKEAAPLTQPIAEVCKRGIPVIVLDRAVDGEAFTVFIGADNQRIGREAGKYAQKLLGGKGKIVELQGLMTSKPAQDRHSGFLEGIALDENPDLKIVFSADMQWLEPNARREMESALAKEPEISLVYAHNDPGAHGAYLAGKAAGRERKTKFIGIDALPHEGVHYVKEGILDATFAYPTGGAEAVQVALDILAGKTPPKRITLGTKIYTRENVERGGEEIR